MVDDLGYQSSSANIATSEIETDPAAKGIFNILSSHTMFDNFDHPHQSMFK